MTLLEEDVDLDFLKKEIEEFEAEHGELVVAETPATITDCWGCGFSCYPNCAVGCHGSCSAVY